MKRNLNQLTSWNNLNNKLEKKAELAKQFFLDETQYQIARSIVKLRLDKKISQLELAKKIGTKQPAISRLESGSFSPSISLLQKIALATNTKLTVSFT
ncbi:helix-turn-helix transcriptional regulator [Candidatus Shapirobacteria bacterium]|nr:helix-turn-helix transcriptional regulator [Candidatus Shapirobacteria bacterium]